MIGILDNYDSFTYNLVQRVGELNTGLGISVWRNDQVTVDELRAAGITHLIVSPGPGTPAGAGISMDVIRAFADTIPILGVCLGHQCLGCAFGGRVIRERRLMHGKISTIRHDGAGVYRGLLSPFVATRYHSLSLETSSLPSCFQATAWTSDDELMGIRHRELPLEGVQFHPESFLTDQGHRLLANFLAR